MCKATTDFTKNNYVEKLVSYVYPVNAQIIKYEGGVYTQITYKELNDELKNYGRL